MTPPDERERLAKKGFLSVAILPCGHKRRPLFVSCGGCYESLQSRLWESEVALRRYGKHHPGCHEEGHSCRKSCEKRCSCGLDTALAGGKEG